MRTNGYICPQSLTRQGVGSLSFNEYGEPVTSPSQEEFGEPIECWAQVNTDEAMGVYEDGEFRRCAFTVLVEECPLDCKSLKLVKEDEDLGVFRVMQRQNLSRMGRITLLLRR